MTNNGIKTILPIINSEEKLDEINRLLDILSKRKRYSILVTMLLVFQKYKFQKLLKEFLVEGVQQIILANPFKVVSFSGVPFTIKNCFMGMRVIIGKHRIFQKEMVDGYEYLNVNLVYTCIFLTDEIAKICKGSKNSKPVHSSLLDELDIMENNGNNNNNTSSGLNLGGLGSYNSSSSNKSTNNTSNNNLLSEKRKRSKGESEEEENDDEEQEQEQDQDQEEEQEQENFSDNSEYEESSAKAAKKSKNKKENKANKPAKNNQNKRNNKTNNKANNKANTNTNSNSSSKQMQAKLPNNDTKNEKTHKSNDNIISLEDSVEDDENGAKGNNRNNTQKKTNNKNPSKKEKTEKKESNPLSQLFANIFYPKDVNYFKCSLQDFLSVWNFDKSSPVNVYLKDNYQNISKIKNVFIFMQNIGEKGQNFLEKLIKYIPELNNAANLTEEEKSKINENEDLKESKEILDKINSINLVFKEYDNKKKKLINIYQRIKSTVENIKIGATSEGKLFLKEDVEYLDMINKRFDQIMSEIIPLFNQLCEFYKDHMLKNLSFNLQNVSRNLKENDLTLKAFSIFTQNLIQLFPRESGDINTVNDLILNESMSVEERDKIFRDIITREKDRILNNIEEYKKIYENNENKTDVEERKENIGMED